MRVLQLIDSLDAGGAERMAVNLYNDLQKLDGVDSFLIATRKEGVLRTELQSIEKYYFLNRKRTFDCKALIRMNRFIKKEKIKLIHVHGTSIFFAFLYIILFRVKVSLIWHDHNGNRNNTKKLAESRIRFILSFYKKIIIVSNRQRDFFETINQQQKVVYLPNYTYDLKNRASNRVTSTFKIVYTANLREPKNHLNAVKALHIIREKYKKNVTLHLIGNYIDNEYYRGLKQYIEKHKLEQLVIFHGKCTNVQELLCQFNLGLITSDSEGLPVSLLEYGMVGLPVISTHVGECKAVLNGFGITIPKNNPEYLANAIISYMNNEKKQENDRKKFHLHILKNYTKESVLEELYKVYSEVYL